MASNAREIELKLRLPRSKVQALLAHPALKSVKRGRARTETLANAYFDTSDWRLARDAIALRIRSVDRRHVQTVKGAEGGEAGGGLSARAEHEWPLATGDRVPAPDIAATAATPFGKRIAKAAGKPGFGVRFSTDYRRTTVPLAFPDSTLAELCVDVGEVRVLSPRRARAAFCEVELELEAGAPERLFELALALCDDLPLRVETRSKAARGHALSTGAAASPAQAEEVRLPNGADAAGAIAAIVRNCLRQVEANADGLLAGDDPEWVHQLRVGVRRLRSILRLTRRHVPPMALGHLEDDLRWLAGALGPARDLDVFTGETLPAMREATRRAAEGAEALEPALAQLEAHARVRLAEAWREAREAVASKRFQRLLLTCGAFAAAPRLGAAGGSPEALVLDAPATALAAALLGKRHRKLERRVERLSELSPGERHEVRILAKRLRYATESFAPLYPRKRTRAYRKALAELQAVLGTLNDAAVAAALAAELSEPGSPGAAMFAGWAAAQGEAAGRALERTRKAFVDAPPFW